MSHFSKEELKKLNTNKSLVRLLRSPSLNFKENLEFLEYQEELEQLHVKMIKLQNWVIKRQERIVIIVEGREFAGKGGLIRAFTGHLRPRAMKVVALSKPTENQKKEWYFKRYIDNLPEPGEIAFFDRSWYNRAIVEPVNGFCSDAEYHLFMSTVNQFEDLLYRDGFKIIKFYLSINKEELNKRIEAVKNNPLRSWELTQVDLNAAKLWDEFTAYKERMFEMSAHLQSAWVSIDSNNQQKAHLKAIKYCLDQFPYED